MGGPNGGVGDGLTVARRTGAGCLAGLALPAALRRAAPVRLDARRRRAAAHNCT